MNRIASVIKIIFYRLGILRCDCHGMPIRGIIYNPTMKGEPEGHYVERCETCQRFVNDREAALVAGQHYGRIVESYRGSGNYSLGDKIKDWYPEVCDTEIIKDFKRQRRRARGIET